MIFVPHLELIKQNLEVKPGPVSSEDKCALYNISFRTPGFIHGRSIYSLHLMHDFEAFETCRRVSRNLANLSVSEQLLTRNLSE